MPAGSFLQIKPVLYTILNRRTMVLAMLSFSGGEGTDDFSVRVPFITTSFLLKGGYFFKERTLKFSSNSTMSNRFPEVLVLSLLKETESGCFPNCSEKIFG